MKKKTAWYGMVLSLALLLNYVESLIPIPIAIPGIKLGLTNCVILFLLYRAGIKEAFIISAFRVILVGFLFGNMAAILYSACGALCSILIMYGCKRSRIFSMIGVSVAGGIAHNLGQLSAAAFVVGAGVVIYYVPILLVSGVITGVIIGVIGREVVKRLPAAY